jgi:hypothetical protein
MVAGGSGTAPDGANVGSLTSGPAAYRLSSPPGRRFPPLHYWLRLQQVVLTATTNLIQPTGLPTGTFNWWLVIDNPGSSPYALIPDATYLLSSALVVAPGTRTVIDCMTTQSGLTMMG